LSKRKTAQRKIGGKAEPVSQRKWLIIDAQTGKPTIGCSNLFCDGIMGKEKAERQSSDLKMDTSVVAHHDYYGLPDPDADGTD
jgi:hypothetical protein